VVKQTEISIETANRGFFVITDAILNAIDISDIKAGMLNIFLNCRFR
jgi:thiamine phosphate synthase YjbQ (UPF0047 family)